MTSYKFFFISRTCLRSLCIASSTSLITARYLTCIKRSIYRGFNKIFTYFFILRWGVFIFCYLSWFLFSCIGFWISFIFKHKRCPVSVIICFVNNEFKRFFHFGFLLNFLLWYYILAASVLFNFSGFLKV